MDSTVNERTFVSSLVAKWSIGDLTPSVNTGPIVVGVCHGDYTDTEILEYLTQAGSWNETDLIAQERAKRKIRVVGYFSQPLSATDILTLNDGRAIKTKLNWLVAEGQGLNFFVYNLGTSALAGTQPNVNVQGHANLFGQ